MSDDEPQPYDPCRLTVDGWACSGDAGHEPPCVPCRAEAWTPRIQAQVEIHRIEASGAGPVVHAALIRGALREARLVHEAEQRRARPRPTARDVAVHLLAEVGRMPMVKLQALLFLAQLESVRDHGVELFDEPMFAERSGPVAKSVTTDWLRRFWVGAARAQRRGRALQQRVRRWAIREAGLDPRRVGKINMPGGWSERDGFWQALGLAGVTRRQTRRARRAKIARP